MHMRVRPRPSRRSALAILIVLAVGLAVLPAAATTVPAAATTVSDGRPTPDVVHPGTADLLRSLPDGALSAHVVDGALVRTPRSGQEALLAVRDHRDVGAWLGSIAVAARAASGLDAVGAARPGLLEAGEEDMDDEGLDEDGWAPWTGSFADAGPAGDLTGDGRDDVLVADYDLDSGTVQLRALRGVDGSELWRQPFAAEGGLAFPIGADLDGDGVDDLLRLALSVHRTDYVAYHDSWLTGSATYEHFSASYTWTIAVVSGADGTTRWARSANGSLEQRYEAWRSTTSAEERYDLESTNLGFFPVLLRDGEVALEGIDLDIADRYGRDGTFLIGADELELTLRSATRLDVRDGRTGGHLRSHRAGPGPALTFLSALPGDAGALLAERMLIGDERYACAYAVVLEDCTQEVGELGLEVAVLDAASFAPRWSRTIDAWFGWAVPLEADLTGSGTGDLVVVDLGGSGFGTTLLDGADGGAAWSHLDDDDWRYPLATGALGGGPGPDLLTAAFQWDGDGLGLRFDRLDGPTGEVLRSSRYMVELPDDGSASDPLGDALEDPIDWLFAGGGWSFTGVSLYAYPLDDVDGDGALDLGVGSSVFTYDFDSWEDTETWDVRIESGATAAALHTDGGDGYGFIVPLADVTGDGVTEARRVVRDSRWWWGGDEDDWDADDADEVEDGSVQEVLSLRTFTALWSADPWGWLVDGGDQDGQPGAELLHLEDHWDDEEVTTTIRSLEGQTGALRWTVRSETAG
jgi:hypothetical protein